MSDVVNITRTRTDLLESVAILNASRGTQTTALAGRMPGAKEALRDLRVELEGSGIDVATLELYNSHKGSVPTIPSLTSSSSNSNIDLQV